MHDKWSDIVDTMLPGTYGWKQVDRGSLYTGQFFRLANNNGQMEEKFTYIAIHVGPACTCVALERFADGLSVVNDFPLPPTVYVPFMFGMFDDEYKGNWINIGFDFVETFK